MVMRALGVALGIVVTSATCMRPGLFECVLDTECSYPSGHGMCEANHRCSFPDATCASGRRFGALSGSVANRCVDDGAGHDGGIDGPAGGDAAVDAAVDAPVDAPPVDCPATYTALDGLPNVYRVLPTAASWATQRAACASDQGTTYLAIPDSAVELQALVTLVGADVWVGISDVANEGEFITVTGAAPAFLPWAPGEPDNMGNQDCVRTIGAAGQLETRSCGTSANAVCECEPP